MAPKPTFRLEPLPGPDFLLHCKGCPEPHPVYTAAGPVLGCPACGPHVLVSLQYVPRRFRFVDEERPPPAPPPPPAPGPVPAGPPRQLELF